MGRRNFVFCNVCDGLIDSSQHGHTFRNIHIKKWWNKLCVFNFDWNWARMTIAYVAFMSENWIENWSIWEIESRVGNRLQMKERSALPSNDYRQKHFRFWFAGAIIVRNVKRMRIKHITETKTVNNSCE